jgi:hypothetical protein
VDYVDDNIGGRGSELAGAHVDLEDGDSSSDAGYQADDEGEAEVLSNGRRIWENGVRNILQRRVRARLN